MSNTRRSSSGVASQERFCSAPEFEGETINGLYAAKRIKIIDDEQVQRALWFIQFRSLEPRGLQRLTNELVEAFPGRVGTPAASSWDEMELREAVAHLPQHLIEFCLNPKTDIRNGVWFFDDLFGALTDLRSRYMARARGRIAQTTATRHINETLDFWHSERCMVGIEGAAGIGRTVSGRAWVNAQAGMVRFVEVPSSGDDRSLYVNIARQLGVACGASYKAQQMKVRIEEMLLASGLSLVLDESQYLWGNNIRPRKTPDRILWIKSLFDSGTPIALIAHTDFTKWQQHYVKLTLWTDEQFERRVNRGIVILPEESVRRGKANDAGTQLAEQYKNAPTRRVIPISAASLKQDMLKIARVHHPDGDKRSWAALASYALGAEKKLASGVEHALASARYRARCAGREQVTLGDIVAALREDHAFLLDDGYSATPSQPNAKAVAAVFSSDSTRLVPTGFSSC